MTRLHRRYFGPLWPGPSAEIDPTFSSLQLSITGIAALMHQLTAPGIWRGGPLLGRVSDDVLHIQMVAPGSYRHWNDPLLEGNVPYQLGLIDAVRSHISPPIDWVGNWVMRPDNVLPSLTECESWLRQGAATGLFDDTSPLLAAGLQDEHFETTAYLLIAGTVTSIDVTS